MEYLVALVARIRRNDSTLTHLEPYYCAEEQRQQQQQGESPSLVSLNNNNHPNNKAVMATLQPTARAATRHMSVWSSAASQFHMMMVLDNPSVQAALDDLWRACREATNNTSIRKVTLPAIWPCPDLRHAVHAIMSLPRMEDVYIVARRQEQKQSQKHREEELGDANESSNQEMELEEEEEDDVMDTDDEDDIITATRTGVWHASPLILRRDILPLLEAAAEHINPLDDENVVEGEIEQYLGFQHLHVDSRLAVQTQQDIDDLGSVLARNTHLQTLSLHLVPRVVATPFTLNPVIQAVVDLSHPISHATGLRTLTLAWGGEQVGPERPAFSTMSIARLLESYSLDNEGITSRPSTLVSLRLENCLLTDDHLMAVAEALKTNTTLRKLRIFGHTSPENGGVSLRGLKEVRDVLESKNYTLHKISLYTPQEDSPARVNLHAATRRLISVIRRTLDGHGAEDEYDEYYRTQHEMEIYCRLNRLGRGALVSPETKITDWIETLAKCCNSNDSSRSTVTVPSATGQALTGTSGSAPSSRLNIRHSDGLVDVGLNEIYILLRTHPSICHLDQTVKRPSRQQQKRVPKELLPAPGHIAAEGSNLFKTLVTPPTTISQAFAMKLRKQQSRPKSTEDLVQNR